MNVANSFLARSRSRFRLSGGSADECNSATGVPRAAASRSTRSMPGAAPPDSSRRTYLSPQRVGAGDAAGLPLTSSARSK